MNSRKIFIETLTELAEHDNKIILIAMDVGFSFIEGFKEKFPDRYFNFGVTEQSTVLVATALALAGFKPYIYSMINFVIFRPYEQVRNGVCYHNANVKLLGVSGSEKYKFLGFSHNITKNEDVDALKNMPNIESFVPKTEGEVKEVIMQSYQSKKPTYIRL